MKTCKARLDRKTFDAIGAPFNTYAVIFNIDLLKDDLDYIQNVIRKSNVAQLVFPTPDSKLPYRRLNEVDSVASWCNIVVLCEGFYDDPKCPCNLRKLLWLIMGAFRHWINSQTGGLQILAYRRCYIERWFEKCR